MVEAAIDDFPLFKQELYQVEATIFNNMAACYKKELNNKMEVEYTTKVIEKQKYLTDKNVLLKAYLRRGLAYEEMEKYLQAKEDMLSVKQLQHDNKQASQCLNRVNKAIQQVYGDRVPEIKQNGSIKMATGAGYQTPAKQEQAEPKKESPRKDEMSLAQLKTLLLEHKDNGNKEFKGKVFVMAATHFTEGIKLY